MKYYSSRNRNLKATLQEAVIRGLAPDGGLYMPSEITPLPAAFFQKMSQRSFREIALDVATHVIGTDVPHAALKKIIDHTLEFDAPLMKIETDVYALELFHGPTLAFKDFGARFLSALMGYFATEHKKEIVILAATSGDTGSAVANGFLNVHGTRVIVLYPSGRVSALQEKQFTTLGGNITALEISGTFDDCQEMVKKALQDTLLKRSLTLASANSINIGRLIPQMFYYFNAAARLVHRNKPVVFSVPSGNFGNLTAGLWAKKLGLDVRAFVAATNINDVVPVYLNTGSYSPGPSHETISNAMDVGSPSNFERLIDLYGDRLAELKKDVYGYSFTDHQTQQAMRSMYMHGYIADPHGAVGYLGLKKFLSESHENVSGVFLETAHPGKFKDVVEATIHQTLSLPDRLDRFQRGEKRSVTMANDFETFRSFLLK